MSKLMMRKAEQQELIDCIIAEIIGARERLGEKLNFRLTNVLVQYLGNPADTDKEDPRLWEQPIKYFFKDKILPEIRDFSSDPIEMHYLVVLLLERLMPSLTASYHHAMKQKEIIDEG